MTTLPTAATALEDLPRAHRRIGSAVSDYLALTKPRIISLLLFTSVAALLGAAHGRPTLAGMLAVLGAGAMAAGGANAINCALEGDLDRRMARTSRRPVASGRIPAASAGAFGAVLTVASATWLALATNPVAAAISVLGGAWYVGVYTLWLKRRSSQNIVIGGAAGCFPPLVGWAAATGHVDPTAIALAAVIFFWTPPHFWALATLLRADYQRADVPMLPVIASPAVVARRMRWYAAATLAVSILPLAWSGLGVIYLASAVSLGTWFARLTWKFPVAPRSASRLFHGSLLYLFMLFAAVAIDRGLVGWR